MALESRLDEADETQFDGHGTLIRASTVPSGFERNGSSPGGDRIIPVAAPVLAGNERAYVDDCLDTNWISSSGAYVERFERMFADFCGVRHAVSCCNGTVALHLTLLACGIGSGDEVIVPDLTFVASANAVTYCGATPVFVDVDAQTWTIDTSLIEERITPQTRAIIAVHLYGHMCDMDALRVIAARHNLIIIEDAAEAHGARFRDEAAGALGRVATFSFYGNKIISTGEGGMVVTDDARLAEQVRLLRGQGMDSDRRYWFPVIGYNYRLTNIAAAIGCAQMEKIEWHLARRREVASWYTEELASITAVSAQTEAAWTHHAYWMFTVLIDPAITSQRDAIMRRLYDEGIETRPIFYPLSSLPPYSAANAQRRMPVATDLAARGICLPTWAGLTRYDVRRIVTSLARCCEEALCANRT